MDTTRDNLTQHFTYCKFKRRAWIITVLFFLSSCVDIVEVKIDDPDEFPLVIDGIAAIKDTTGVSYVRLTKAFSLSSPTEDRPAELFNALTPYSLQNPVREARVELKDQNNQKYTLNEFSPGWYLIRNNIFETGNSYSISVWTEGEHYESTFQTLHPTPHIDSVAVLSNEYLSQNGLFFNGLINTNSNYVCSSFKISNDAQAFYTWGHLGVNLGSFKSFDEIGLIPNSIIPLEANWFDFVPRFDGKLSQLRINENFFNYINDAQNIINDSSPFSTPPVNPTNNLRCVSNPQKQVLGFFEVASLAEKSYKGTN